MEDDKTDTATLESSEKTGQTDDVDSNILANVKDLLTKGQDEIDLTGNTKKPADETDDKSDKDADDKSKSGDSKDTNDEIDAKDSKDSKTDEDETGDKSKEEIGVQKKIDKLTWRAKAAEEKLAEVEKKLSAQSDSSGPAVASEVNDIWDVSELDKLAKSAQVMIDFAEDHEAEPEGVTLNEGQDNEMHLERKDLLARKRKAKATLSEIKGRRAFLGEHADMESIAEEVYPWLNDPEHAGTALVKDLLKAIPGLKQSPDYTLNACDMLVGMQLRLSKSAKKTEDGKADDESDLSKKIGEDGVKQKSPAATKLPGNNPPKLSNKKANNSLNAETLQKIAEGDDDALIGAVISKFST